MKSPDFGGSFLIQDLPDAMMTAREEGPGETCRRRGIGGRVAEARDRGVVS